jgi:hypothetical protein
VSEVICKFCGVGRVTGRRRVYCSEACAQLGAAHAFWSGEIRRAQPQMIRADRQLERIEHARGLRAVEAAEELAGTREPRAGRADYEDPHQGTENPATRIAASVAAIHLEEVQRAHLESLRRLRRAVDNVEHADEVHRQVEAMAREAEEMPF